MTIEINGMAQVILTVSRFAVAREFYRKLLPEFGMKPVFSPPRVCDLTGSEESVRRLAQQQLFENYQIADDKLASREWFFEHFTAVDVHFFWCFRRGTQFNLDVSPFRNCLAHFERMKQRPRVRKLLAYEEEVQTAFAQAA